MRVVKVECSACAEHIYPFSIFSASIRFNKPIYCFFIPLTRFHLNRHIKCGLNYSNICLNINFICGKTRLLNCLFTQHIYIVEYIVVFLLVDHFSIIPMPTALNAKIHFDRENVLLLSRFQ